MKIAIVDHSTPPVDLATLQLIAASLFCQLCEVASAWSSGNWTPITAPVAIEIKATTDTLAADEFELGLWNDPDVAGAGGYHAADPRGKPYGKVFRSTTDGLLQGSFPLSVVCSHEAIEMFLDMPASLFSARADGVKLDALEGGDALQGTDYQDPEGRGVTLANYLLPAAFDAGSPGPYDRQGVLRGQYDTTPGGYRIILSATVDQSGAARYRCEAHYGPEHPMARAKTGDPLAEAKRLAHLHPGSRASQRGVEVWLPLVPSDVATADETVIVPPPPPTQPAPPASDPVIAIASDETEALALKARIEELEHSLFVSEQATTVMQNMRDQALADLDEARRPPPAPPAPPPLVTEGQGPWCLFHRKLDDGTDIAFHWKGSAVDNVVLVVDGKRASLRPHDAKLLSRFLSAIG